MGGALRFISGIVHVHGWVYQIEAGRIRELGISSGPDANLATEKA